MFSYIHIPFCDSKCKFCRFASVGSIDKVLVKRYLSHLIQDIKDFKKPVENAGFLKSVYFWWWTPAILEIKDLENILSTLKQKIYFKKNIEITLETTPRNVTLENINWWESLGINRLSMWIQTLNNKSLKEIKRDDRNYIFSALENLKHTKIKNISVDFIIWLPFVKKWETLKDIIYVLNNYKFIKHISVYMLEDFYDVNIYDNAKFEKIIYPNNWKDIWIKEESYLKEYLEIKNYLESLWFNRYELSNFSKKWFECRHNKSYWNHSEVVWFWLWSHSFIWKNRYAYKDDFLWYYQKKLAYNDLLSKKDIFIEKIMLWFRTKWITKTLAKKLNQDKLNDFLKTKVLEIKDKKISIKDNYITLIDKIILELI